MPRYEGPSPINLAAAEKAKAQAAAKAKAQQVSRNIVGTYGGALSRYKPPEKEQELIGVQDAVLFWASESGVDNSTDDAGNSGIHKYIFDTTTYADKAQIKLLNDSGATQYVRAVAIKAKPVIRKNAWEHDSFVDYQDIFFNGENVFEFGNNYVVSKSQLESLTDYYAKALGAIQGNTSSPKNKHLYVLSIPGRCWHFEPGEWVVVQIGASGEKEYIDSTCEIYNVTVEAGAGDLGSTVVTLREVEQNWVKDSNAVARYLATGDPKWLSNNLGQVVVASRDYLGVADYYCDGTEDQEEIQAAVDYITKAFGAGVVQLTEGQYNTTAAITLNHNDVVLVGRGSNTVIEKTGNFNGISSSGSSGSEINRIRINNLKIKANATDETGSHLIYLNYSDSAIIENVWMDACSGDGFNLVQSDDCLLSSCIASNCLAGFRLLGTQDTPLRSRLIGNLAKTNDTHGFVLTYIEQSTLTANESDDNTWSGIYLENCSFNTISACVSRANGPGASFAGIILVTSHNNVLSGNITSFNNARGIWIYAGSNYNVVTGNRSIGNSLANFTDSGTGTVDSGNDWHGQFGTVAETMEVTDTAAGTVV